MATNWQITRRIIWYHVKKDGKGALPIFLLIAVIIGVFWRVGERITSTVVANADVAGTIHSVQVLQADPAEAVGRGFSYRYGIRLNENGKIVFASKRAKQPKRIGDNVVLIRSDRENSLASYRFAPAEPSGD